VTQKPEKTQRKRKEKLLLPIISVIVVLTLSLIITRIAAVALTLTGLSRQSARFQARSAFTGVGFTTDEAEKVVNHPVRRRILMLLMLLGNAGVITAVASLILTFTDIDSASASLWRILWLVLGLTVLWLIVTSSWIDQRTSEFVTWALKRWTNLDVRDYARVLHLAGDFGVIEMAVEPDDWLADKTLAELNLNDEGVLVLGVRRPNGIYIGAPKGSTLLHEGDTITLYGRSPVLADLDNRRDNIVGELAHNHSKADQQRVLSHQKQVDQDA
jgi:hypothetical protein